MLCKRVIPTMLVRGRTLVKGRQFSGDRSIGHAQQAARVHALRGVDELLILDIGATPENRGPDLDLVRALSAGCFIPITVGGGVKTIEDIRELLRAGADKVCIHSGRSVIAAAAEHFGRQAIVYSLDHIDDADPDDVADVARNFQTLGAGEIILQNMDRDGTMTGFNLDMIERVAAAVTVPLIASGGCSGYADMAEALKRGASGVACGALFAFTDATPKGAAQYLRGAGFPVRL